MDRYRQEWIESSCPVELNVSSVFNLISLIWNFIHK